MTELKPSTSCIVVPILAGIGLIGLLYLIVTVMMHVGGWLSRSKEGADDQQEQGRGFEVVPRPEKHTAAPNSAAQPHGRQRSPEKESRDDVEGDLL